MERDIQPIPPNYSIRSGITVDFQSIGLTMEIIVKPEVTTVQAYPQHVILVRHGKVP